MKMERTMSILLTIFMIALIAIGLTVPGAIPVLALAALNAVVIRKLIKKAKENS